MRYPKKKILEAYLNEIYLGGGNGVSLSASGPPSRAYFGKDANQLDLAEAATLAGMIPVARQLLAGHPPGPRQAAARLGAAAAWPSSSSSPRSASTRRCGSRSPWRPRRSSAGAPPTSPTRRPWRPRAASASTTWRTAATCSSPPSTGRARRRPRRRSSAGLEGDRAAAARRAQAGRCRRPWSRWTRATGGILAYVGGRGYDASQFDRAGRAQRQPGSAFKPIVYAAAFEAGKATPASFLEDEPLAVPAAGGQVWSPKNDDGSFHGWVRVRTALEKSYNPATTRLALEVGMPQVVELAHEMGITTPIEPFPAMALGAAEVTPLEMATVYSTLAGGGLAAAGPRAGRRPRPAGRAGPGGRRCRSRCG